jgi:anti-sigma factor RsiW
MTDDELDQRIRASILAEEVDTSGLELAIRKQIRNRRSVPRWAFVAAAAIAVAIAGSLAYRTFFTPPPICLAAAQDHEREIVNGEPRRWQSDLSGIQGLAAKQGVPASAIAALGTAGYRLERGRLCFLKKQVFLHLVYTKNGSQYSVYLRPRGNEASFSNSVRETKTGTENLAYFETNQVMAVFVSHTPGTDVLAFARDGARVL